VLAPSFRDVERAQEEGGMTATAQIHDRGLGYEDEGGAEWLRLR